MSDDGTTGSVEQGGGAGQHQDIVHRILEYQRQLREGDPPPPPVATIPDRPPTDFAAAEAFSTEATDLVDLTGAEAVLEADTRASAARADDEPSRQDGGAVDEQIAEVVRLVEDRPAGASFESGVWAVPTRPAQEDRADRAALMAEVERALQRVAETITDLRQRFQDMAVASDERLAELEEIVERARRATRV